MEHNCQYSIVIPVYNGEETIEELFQDICKVFNNIGSSYEVIMVDDYSKDNSWKKMEELHSKNTNLKIIHLLKNFGQHNATYCAFNYCSGDYIITMDDDLQHPPQEIPKLINKINEGYLVVYGKYNIKQHSIIENFLSKKHQQLLHNLLSIPTNISITSFAIYDYKVIKSILSKKSSYILLSALTSKSVSMDKVTNVTVEHKPREYGTSNYSFLKYLNLSMNLLFNYSALPLLTFSFIGVVISILSIVYGASIIIRHILNPNYGIIGWNSTMVSITFINGIILMFLGVIGEYLRRVLNEVSYSQPYVVDIEEV